MSKEAFIIVLALVATWCGIGIGDEANYFLNHSKPEAVTMLVLGFVIGLVGLIIFCVTKDERDTSWERDGFGERFLMTVTPSMSGFGFGSFYATIVGPWWREEASAWLDYWLIVLVLGLIPILVLCYEHVTEQLYTGGTTAE